MKKSYYLFNPGRMSRKDNTLKFVPLVEEKEEVNIESVTRYLPIEGIESLYVFGSLDTNSAMYNFLGKQHIAVHFFDFYDHYTGSFMPKDYLLAGKMIIAQAGCYLDPGKRIIIAQRLVEGAAFNMLKNLRYYYNRDKDTMLQIARIENLMQGIAASNEVEVLMGIEGNIRMSYYEAFNIIINDFKMGERRKQPPSNEVNALISFINSMCYTLCLDMIYHTQLNPTISFLHQPGERRYSLALDLAEIFKPILADRLIFSLLNKKRIQASDFDTRLNSCLLKESGRKKIVKSWDERLDEKIRHRVLNRNISYKNLVKLECYKICKHLLGMAEYEPFKAWW
ncbi:MAG TPA: type I-B CRISPR-associated endonuclease Cas1b, partial [Puia sp.]|nr:type I-B CRISPR-associated endonuclease Cas1b [Puia sp.]